MGIEVVSPSLDFIQRQAGTSFEGFTQRERSGIIEKFLTKGNILLTPMGILKEIREASSGWLTRTISSSRAPFAFLTALLTLTIAYRVQLTIGLFTHPMKPFEFSPGAHPVQFALSYWYYDIGMVLPCFLLFWILWRGGIFLRGRKIFIPLQILGFIFLHMVLFSLLCIHQGHVRILFEAQTGFDYSVIQELIHSISSQDILKFMEVRDYLFLLIPFVIFWLVWWAALAVRVWIVKICLIIVIIFLAIPGFAVQERKESIPREIRLNPAYFLLSDVAEQTLFRPSEKERAAGGIQEKESGLQPTGPLYSHAVRSMKILPPKTDQKWNVVLLILESVGTRYMLDHRNGIPMPFLNQLTKEGWFLKNHYTTSNVSTKAVFSIFSGLYDLFNRGALGIREDAQVPALYNFLGQSYDGFLVSPSSSTWYFPARFIKNSGLPEVHTYENLNFNVREELHTLGRYIARDEIQTVDFFIRRLSRAREPFLGIYISFAAHFPYFDYGAEYRIREDNGRFISRYYNNLYLLDRMIKRIFEQLGKQGRLERTIVVIVGDHGQAFGQHHPDNYLHYRYSYNVNLEAPAIFYQPKLFQPKAFDFPTSHIDILPTLLDALRIPYDPALFDGESLFQRKLKRKYIFFYGLEESISSLHTQGIKVQVSLKKNRCWAFDLEKDREEKNPLDCSLFPTHLEALRNFVSHHDSSLIQYNTQLREGRDFRGHRHPKLFTTFPSQGRRGRNQG